MNNGNENRGVFARFMETLLQLGLGESLSRAGTAVLSLLLLGAVIWVMQISSTSSAEAGNEENVPLIVPTVGAAGGGNDAQVVNDPFGGVPRLAQEHTIIPSRPRQEIVKYTVLEGDSVFGIAEKFGLNPETILWGNYYILLDNPHSLRPGQELNILPINGTYHEWQEGEGLNGVAAYYHVTPEDIINYPPNELELATIGDFANPNIQPGTWLIVPNGRREFVAWSAPLGVTRENPASARVLGAGACGSISGGAVGYGTFVWPSNKTFISGFDYSPNTNHWGIDIAGNEGEGVYATDAGVIVFAGWNDYGYGNMIMVDHGSGFQSLYAHLNALNVVCGQSIGQGDVIGAIGSTGRSSGAHLHFEIRAISSFVNPWDVLPPP
jgi:murein DD-endopeptidase MepM/ murein hydrolase activator NlpD